MLTRFHKILIAALAVQLVLAVIVLTRGDDSAALKEHAIVPGFDAAKVTRIQVFSSATGKPIDLVKKDAAKDSSWVLASGFDYPVESAKVNDLLSPIVKLAAAAPIATQSSRHVQLHVADTDFERKLVITAGGKDLTLYIGSPAGTRRTAVRVVGDDKSSQDKVYAVTGFSPAVAGSEPRQWVDTSYLKIPKDEIGKLVVSRDDKTVEVARPAPAEPAGSGSATGSGSAAGSAAPPSPPAAEHWNVTIGGAPISLAAGESIDQAAIDRILGQVAAIDLSSPADPKRDAGKPTATITIERKATGGATPAPTVLDVIADGTAYWVHDRSSPRAVLVDKARLDEVLGVERDKLVKKPPPPAPPATPPGAGAGSSAKPGTGAAGSPPRPGAGSAVRPGPG